MIKTSIVRKITSKRQVTLPKKVVDMLKSDQIVFEISNSQIRILPVEMSLEEAFGSVVSPKNLTTKTEAEIEEILAKETTQKFKSKL